MRSDPARAAHASEKSHVDHHAKPKLVTTISLFLVPSAYVVLEDLKGIFTSSKEQPPSVALNPFDPTHDDARSVD